MVAEECKQGIRATGWFLKGIVVGLEGKTVRYKGWLQQARGGKNKLLGSKQETPTLANLARA